MAHLPSPMPRTRLAILTATAAVVVVGCSSTKDGTPDSGPTRPATNPAQGATNSVQGATNAAWNAPAGAVDACSAIHLDVSAANTAAGDRLPPAALGIPPPVPGIGDGARMILVGTIEFPAGGRACQVQVVGLADDAAKQAAITLAGLVRGRASTRRPG